MVTLNEVYECPHCKQVGKIRGVQNLFDDARFDTMYCEQCGCQWRVYYKVSNINAEVVYMPQDQVTPVDVPVEDVPEFTETEVVSE